MLPFLRWIIPPGLLLATFKGIHFFLTKKNQLTSTVPSVLQISLNVPTLCLLWRLHNQLLIHWWVCSASHLLEVKIKKIEQFLDVIPAFSYFFCPGQQWPKSCWETSPNAWAVSDQNLSLFPVWTSPASVSTLPMKSLVKLVRNDLCLANPC